MSSGSTAMTVVKAPADAEKAAASCTVEDLAEQVKALTAQIAEAKRQSACTGATDGPDLGDLSAAVKAMHESMTELSDGKKPSESTAWAKQEYETWAATSEKGHKCPELPGCTYVPGGATSEAQPG